MESTRALAGVPAAATAVASAQTQKFSLLALTMMVVGSMVGAGIFSLPRAFGERDRAVRRHHRLDHRRRQHVHAGERVPGAR